MSALKIYGVFPAEDDWEPILMTTNKTQAEKVKDRANAEMGGGEYFFLMEFEDGVENSGEPV